MVLPVPENAALYGRRRPDHRDPADQKIAVDDDPVRHADHIEPGAAVIEPDLCQCIEIPGRQFEHLRADDELRARLLFSYDIFERGHMSWLQIGSAIERSGHPERKTDFKRSGCPPCIPRHIPAGPTRINALPSRR